MAAELDRLYTYISARLIAVTVERDRTAIEEVHTQMSLLRSAWAEAAAQPPVATMGEATGVMVLPRASGQ